MLSLITAAGQSVRDFVTVRDYSNNELILYNEFGTLMIPQCVKVNEIEVHNTTRCYGDIAVRFKVDEHEINGFLTYNNILKRTSDQVNCDDVRDRPYYLKNSNTVLRHVGSKIMIEEKTNLIRKPLN